MKADCHIHMLLDGQDWRRAIDGHRIQPDRDLIRCRLRQYAEEGFTYLRDGGDRWGVGAAAREIAPEFGITYRTPLSPLCRAGHYGAFIGKKFENLKGYARLVGETRQRGGDFIKIMISGLMDFDRCGVLTEEGRRIEVLCKGVRRRGGRMMNAVRLFCYSELTLYQGRGGKYTLQQADLIASLLGRDREHGDVRAVLLSGRADRSHDRHRGGQSGGSPSAALRPARAGRAKARPPDRQGRL